MPTQDLPALSTRGLAAAPLPVPQVAAGLGEARRLPDRTRRAGTRLAAVLLAALACAAAAFPRTAAADAIRTANIAAELVSEHETIRPGETFTLGIRLMPSPGWHVYWQNPGDTGLPTKVEWKMPEGFRATPLEWPHPVRLGTPPYVTYGYDRDTMLLARIRAPHNLLEGSDVEVVASLKWLSCRDDACVPGKAELPLRIRVESTAPLRDSRWSEAFDQARARVPQSMVEWQAKASLQGDRVRVELTTPGKARPSTTNLQMFPLVQGVIDPSAEPRVQATDAGFVLDVARAAGNGDVPAVLPLVVVAEGGWDAAGAIPALRVNAPLAAGDAGTAGDGKPARGGQAAPEAGASGSAASNGDARERQAAPGTTGEQAAAGSPATGTGTATPTTAPSSNRASMPADAPLSLALALLLAFAGGLVLNLMPCVFPVLSLKVLGFLHAAHRDAAVARRHGLAFTAGVLASFATLAVVLLALRAVGGALGWGFQLQQPLFVAAMAGLLTAMGLNLLGAFEVGSGLQGAAGRYDSQSGYVGSFLSGTLATLLATPCSAPFMGTAVGYALVQPPVIAVSVFLSLGAGMALPYLVLAWVPALMQRLPRPGAWMERFRQAMAFPLLATVAWLVWVFGSQVGNDGVLALLLALLALGAAAWVGGTREGARPGAVARTFAVLLLAASVALAMQGAAARPGPSASHSAGGQAEGPWQPWSEQAVALLRSQGRVVLVDFTADWCLSCKANEAVAMRGADFEASLRSAGAAALKADWTSADPAITAALASFGRSGVPLVLVYPANPTAPPEVLPQLLTPGIVADALTRAAAAR